MKLPSRIRFRGNALLALVIAFLALIVIVVATGKNLLPNWGAIAPTTIWLMAAAVLVVGLARALFEVQRLAREWKALDVVQQDVTRLPAIYRDTAVAQRVAAVEEAITYQRVEREFRHSQRALASTTLSAIGTLTKFGSSTLLVLAVMGTFAGMRSALPQLVAAIGLAGSTDVAAGASSITQALTLIGEAFGANFVALFGSLVLGIASFGASLERRALLTSLETVSERRLYRRLPTDADATELQKAVNEMRQSVNAVADVASSITSLSNGIESLQSVLSNTLSTMHSSFSNTMQQQNTRLQQEISSSVNKVVATLSVTTEALQGTAVAYSGLVKGLEERDLGVRGAAEALSRAGNTFFDLEGRLSLAVEQATALQKEMLKVASQQSQDAETVSSAMTQHSAAVAGVLSGTFDQLGLVSEQFAGAAHSQREVATAISSISSKLTDLGTQLSLSNTSSAQSIVSVIKTSADASDELLRVTLAAQLNAQQSAAIENSTGAVAQIRQALEKLAGEVSLAVSPVPVLEQLRFQQLATVSAVDRSAERVGRSMEELVTELRSSVQVAVRPTAISANGNSNV